MSQQDYKFGFLCNSVVKQRRGSFHPEAMSWYKSERSEVGLWLTLSATSSLLHMSGPGANTLARETHASCGSILHACWHEKSQIRKKGSWV